MTSHPIPFSPAMVRAILSGTKTQTRRIISLPGWATPGSLEEFEKQIWASDPMKGGDRQIHCPYGQPGHSLWVRETYYQRGHWEPITGARTKRGRQKWQFIPADETILFDAPETFRGGRHHQDPATIAWHKRLARFMPRKHSRITLEITSIRVEHLQEITEQDAIAEGGIYLEPDGIHHHGWRHDIHHGFVYSTARESYRALWNSINGPDSWDANLWVWVITFEPSKSAA